MKELGFVITPTGDFIKFGEYNSYLYRDRENKKHYHNTSFREVLKENSEKFPFISNQDDFEIVRDQMFLSENNCISFLNATQGSVEPSIQMGIMVVPMESTAATKKSLLLNTDVIEPFDKGLLYIYIIHDGEVICEYNSIADFYNEYIDYEQDELMSNKSYIKEIKRQYS